jgi:hypothetical protein
MADDAPAPSDAEREAREAVEATMRRLVFDAIAAGVGNSLNDMAAQLERIGEAAIRKIEKLELESARQAVAIARLEQRLGQEQRLDLN